MFVDLTAHPLSDTAFIIFTDKFHRGQSLKWYTDDSSQAMSLLCHSNWTILFMPSLVLVDKAHYGCVAVLGHHTEIFQELVNGVTWNFLLLVNCLNNYQDLEFYGFFFHFFFLVLFFKTKFRFDKFTDYLSKLCLNNKCAFLKKKQKKTCQNLQITLFGIIKCRNVVLPLQHIEPLLLNSNCT